MEGITGLVLDMLHSRCLFDLQAEMLSRQQAIEPGIQAVVADGNLSVIQGYIRAGAWMGHCGGEFDSEEI